MQLVSMKDARLSSTFRIHLPVFPPAVFVAEVKAVLREVVARRPWMERRSELPGWRPPCGSLVELVGEAALISL